MECKVVPVLDTVAGRILYPDGVPMLYIQRSGLWVLFVMGPGSGATGLFIGSLCLASGLSCWARWRARLSSLLKY